MSDGVQQERLKRAKARSLFICTPIARHPVRQYTVSLAQSFVYLHSLGIKVYHQTVVGSSNLARTRNELAAAFLASNYTHMAFIDDDMGWKPASLLRLLASEHDIVAGVGCKKVELPDTHQEKWCFRTLPNFEFHQDEFGMIEVAAVGTGFMMLSRDPFERMKAAHPEWKRKGYKQMPDEARPHYYQFFSFDRGTEDEELGEDIAFCLEYRRLGGRVFVDPEINLVHVGEKEFSGDFGALFAKEEAA